jgi:hypothetical protein
MRVTSTEKHMKSRVVNLAQVSSVMSELVKFLSLSNPLKVCSHHFPGRLFASASINKILLFG